MKEICLIYSTLPTLDLAEGLAKQLIDGRLAACVNIFDGMSSFFPWQGKLTQERECAVLIKTACHKRQEVIDRLLKTHPYETPAVLSLNVNADQAFHGFVLMNVGDD